MAGIISAVIMFSMLFSVGTGYFLFVNTTNTFYVKSLSDRTSAMQAQLNEALVVVSAAGSNNHLTLTVTNNAAISTNITGVLLIDPNKALYTFGVGLSSNTTPALPIGLSQGGSATVDTSLLIVAGTYTIKVLTQRGNAFSATYPPSAVALAEQALASGVIGDLYIAFHSFTWYKVVTCNGTQQCLQKQGNGFAIPATSTTAPIAFSMTVTDLNPLRLNITLDQFTLMTEFVPPVPGFGGGSANSYAWYIVSNSTNVLSAYSKFTLFYNRPVTLVFASSSAGTLVPYAPVILSGTITYGFLVSHGCQGMKQASCQSTTDNYGQVSPYVSTLYY
ncbi:MAG: hypothetical protein E6K86_07345 [Thaumarchaeota archaeon]|nr:MAG: hypothetical protein E6K86_07345 [Nitrososphaerota archaeon]